MTAARRYTQPALSVEPLGVIGGAGGGGSSYVASSVQGAVTSAGNGGKLGNERSGGSITLTYEVCP